MQRIFYSRFGGPDVLQIEQAPVPEPGPGQVLLRVAGAGLNPIDFKTRSGAGFVSQALGSAFHFVPGYDLSGQVVALGEGVNDWVIGDAVFGMVNFPLAGGCYAEYAVADAGLLARAPREMPLAHAAGLGVAGLTAWQSLFDLGGLQAGERVLVLAGAGGVGHLAVQLAAWRGALVSATASPGNHEFLHRHGVAQALDYHDPAQIARSGPWDLVLDLMGGTVGEQALDWLAAGGRLVTVPTNTAAQLQEKGSQRGLDVRPIKVQTSLTQLGQLATLVDRSLLHLQVSAALPLQDAAAAHAQLEQGHVRGKLILVP